MSTSHRDGFQGIKKLQDAERPTVFTWSVLGENNSVSGCGATFYKRQSRGGGAVLERHLHPEGHLAIVLAGDYEEAGDRGCFRVQAGDVIVHSPFEAHVDRFGQRGAEVLDLGIPFATLFSSATPAFVTGTLPDVDEVARLAERDPDEAAAMALAMLRASERRLKDWPHQLAEDLQSDPQLRLEEWADRHGLSPFAVTRGFQKVFGTTPSAYRVQQRARMALQLALNSHALLAEIAICCGFSDQSHMTRAVHALTGHPPGIWRRQAVSLAS